MEGEDGTHAVANKGNGTDSETEMKKDTQGLDDAGAAAVRSHRSGSDLENFLSRLMYGE